MAERDKPEAARGGVLGNIVGAALVLTIPVGIVLGLLGLVLGLRGLAALGFALTLVMPLLGCVMMVAALPSYARQLRAAQARARVRGRPNLLADAAMRHDERDEGARGLIAVHRDRLIWHPLSSNDDLVIERDAITTLVRLPAPWKSATRQLPTHRVEWALDGVAHSVLLATSVDLIRWFEDPGPEEPVELPRATARIKEPE